ncbi:hypothetical protein BGZ73_007838 [Actinomortierella ambigua]|nr:hypothetical protein BGZ73_007838 [Actinomortierella ambigua]
MSHCQGMNILEKRARQPLQEQEPQDEETTLQENFAVICIPPSATSSTPLPEQLATVRTPTMSSSPSSPVMSIVGAEASIGEIELQQGSSDNTETMTQSTTVDDDSQNGEETTLVSSTQEYQDSQDPNDGQSGHMEVLVDLSTQTSRNEEHTVFLDKASDHDGKELVPLHEVKTMAKLGQQVYAKVSLLFPHNLVHNR